MAHISKKGDRWRAEVCIDRKRKAKTFDTKREAVAWANDIEQTGVRPDKTLSDLIKIYIPIAETHKGSESELSRLRHLEKELGHHRLESLTSFKLAEYRDKRLSEVGRSSVRRELTILGAMFEHCLRELGWIAQNPLKSVRKPIPVPSRRRGVSQEEIETICANLAAARSGKQVAQMFLLSIETGMRLGELLSLKWDDVSEKSVTLHDTKNGDTRQVPLSLKAREILKERMYIDPESVFTLTQAQASKCFARHSINGCHFHDSRSEAVTRLSKKLNIMQLARVIGHRDTRSLMYYYAESADDIADRL